MYIELLSVLESRLNDLVLEFANRCGLPYNIVRTRCRRFIESLQECWITGLDPDEDCRVEGEMFEERVEGWVIVMNECDQLIWDYASGDVVCADTGKVVDRIYDYGSAYEREESREWARVEEGKRNRRYGWEMDRKLRDLKRRIRRHFRLLRIAKSIADKGYVVDYGRLFEEERFVFTVYSRRTFKVLKWFERKGLLPVLDGIIDVLRDVEPLALARTVKSRYLLAYLIYELPQGHDPRYHDLGGLRMLIGATTFKRLRKNAFKIVSRHRPLLEEVVRNE